MISLMIATLVAAARSPVSAPDDSLVGLWGADRASGPAVRGLLTIDGRRDPWRAEISGYDVAVRNSADTVSFVLPDGRGEFRGRLDPAGVAGPLVGQWIQAAPRTRGVRYATPVRLDQAVKGVWAGRVRPLEDRLSLYIAIRRDSAGGLEAFIRNPELNLGMGRPFRVSRSGRQVMMVDLNDSTDVVQGVYDEAAGRMSLRLPLVGASFVFTRRDSSDAPGFYPRTPPRAAYTYRQPIPLEDGWSTASLQSVGVDPAGVDSLVEGIIRQPTDSYTAPYPQGLLVALHGKLVVEEYFYGFGPDRTHDTRSAGKTFAPLLVGIARDLVGGLDPSTPIDSLLPEYRPFPNPDPRKQRITLGDLMSMRSGFACNDNDESSPGLEDRMQTQTSEPDWYRYTLSLPMARAPGGDSAVYCTAGINLLGAIVRHATGSRLPEFFRQRVADPLQFSAYHTNLMPTGEAYLGGGIFLRPRDLLKLGQLYLNGGRWNGTRVVSRAWVERSLRPYARFDPGHGYGYGWHQHTFDAAGTRVPEYAAEGNGGQFVMVFPSLDMVVVVTGGNYGNFPTWNRFQNLVAHYLLPGVMDIN